MAPRKRPPSLPHRWQRITDRVGQWGYLAASGPHELTYVAGGLVAGASYECARCGLARLFADVCHVDAEGDRHWRNTLFVGLDWESLTPRHASPPCEVLVRPGSTEAELADLVDERQLELDLGTGAAA